jgi:hypothetical protein
VGVSSTIFRASLYLPGAGFSAVFLVIVVPPLIQTPDVLAVFAAGFVNPYAAGFAFYLLLRLGQEQTAEIQSDRNWED